VPFGFLSLFLEITVHIFNVTYPVLCLLKMIICVALIINSRIKDLIYFHTSFSYLECFLQSRISLECIIECNTNQILKFFILLYIYISDWLNLIFCNRIDFIHKLHNSTWCFFIIWAKYWYNHKIRNFSTGWLIVYGILKRFIFLWIVLNINLVRLKN